MSSLLKNVLKATVSIALVTSGILVAGTIMAAKKIDESGDDLQDKTDSLKDKAAGTVNELSGKITGDTLKEGKGKLQKAVGNAKDKAKDVFSGVKDKVNNLGD